MGETMVAKDASCEGISVGSGGSGGNNTTLDGFMLINGLSIIVRHIGQVF
jgi:hypothetical protein